MDTAINAKTGDIINAITMETNLSYQFPYEEKWFADPNNIESYDKTKVQDITKIEVRYRKGNDCVINYNGTEYAIAPCFFIPNKTELGINTLPESREHKLAKGWLYNRIIKNKDLILIYSTVKRPFDYDNTLSIKEMDIDYNKVGIETTVVNNRTQRADIIIPFKNRHELFGNGIVIEIQFGKTNVEKRSYEWAFKGYSTCWIYFDDFKEISESIIELKEDRLMLQPIDKILHDLRKSNEKDMRELVQNFSRLIDNKMKELNYPFCIGECNQCGEGYMTKKKVKRGENVGHKFYGCSNFPNCRHCIWIEDDEYDSS